MSWHIEKQEEGLQLGFKIKKKLFSKKSKFQNIDVVETYSHGVVMSLDEKIMVTQKDEFVYHEMISHVPLFSLEKANNVLIIGGGDGGTARECLKHKYLKHIDVCEIDKDVIEISKKYLPFTADCLKDKKINVYTEDGNKFLIDEKNKQAYDVIIIDSTDPVGMAAVLIEESFYAKAKKALRPGGIICTQSESPFFMSKTIPVIHKNLSRLFKYVEHYTAPVTTYPSGYWSFAVASDKKIRLNKQNMKQNYSKMKCDFYNEKVHIAAFALPNFFLKLLK